MTRDRPDTTPASRVGNGSSAVAMMSLLSAVLAALVVCAVTALRGTEPFGSRSRGINDLSNQFVPFHAYLWDLLHGRADLTMAWHVGLGIPFLPDYAAYLASPFAPLVALFPRDQIDTAVFVITVLKIAVAAAVMTLYLVVLGRDARSESERSESERGLRSPIVAALLGAAYATCGWALDDAIYVTMWLDSLIALPAIALAMEYGRTRAGHARAIVLPALVVAVFWWANAYSAVMATAGAGTLVLARVVSESPTARAALRDLGRALASVVLGVSLTSAILVQFLSAMTRAQSSPERPFMTYPWDEVLGRALPLTGGVGRSPGFYVGSVVLALALSLPFAPVALRRRLTYAIGALLVLLSMQWPLTQWVWHAFEYPNGSQFRAAFAMCAWLVVCAWIALDALPRRPLALLGGAGGLALLALWAGDMPWTSDHTRTVGLLSAAAVGLLAVTWRLLRERSGAGVSRLAAVPLTILLAVGLVGEGTWTGVVSDAARAERFTFNPDAGPIMDQIEASLSDRPELPAARVAGPQEFGRNEAYLLSIPGGDYYSSTISAAHSVGLRELGVTWTSNGLSVRIGEDSAIRALLGIQSVLDDRGVLASAPPAAPLVRRAHLTHTRAVPSPWEARNRLAGTQLYTVPAVTAPTELAAGESATLTATCPSGTVVTVDAPDLTGSVEDGTTTEVYAQGWDLHAPRELRRPGSGTPQDITVTATEASELPEQPIGCLDQEALREVIAEPAPEIELTGNSLAVRWPDAASADESAVVSVPFYQGWTCRADDRPAEIEPVSGLITVPLRGASELTCSYRQPGLTAGIGLSLISAAALAGLAIVTRRRRSAD